MMLYPWATVKSQKPNLTDVPVTTPGIPVQSATLIGRYMQLTTYSNGLTRAFWRSSLISLTSIFIQDMDENMAEQNRRNPIELKA